MAVDGKEVSTASTYKFSQPKTGEYVIGLAVSDDKGENLQTTMTARWKVGLAKAPLS